VEPAGRNPEGVLEKRVCMGGWKKHYLDGTLEKVPVKLSQKQKKIYLERTPVKRGKPQLKKNHKTLKGTAGKQAWCCRL